MFLTEYDEKLHMEHTFEEGREAGLEQGRKLGMEQGQKLGMKQGQRLGQEQIIFLTQKLLREDRLEDLKRASFDAQFREMLLKEFHLDNHKNH